jgi:hypothetical protein
MQRNRQKNFDLKNLKRIKKFASLIAANVDTDWRRRILVE